MRNFPISRPLIERKRSQNKGEHIDEETFFLSFFLLPSSKYPHLTYLPRVSIVYLMPWGFVNLSSDNNSNHIKLGPNRLEIMV